MVQKGVGYLCRNGPQGASHNGTRPLFEPCPETERLHGLNTVTGAGLFVEQKFARDGVGFGWRACQFGTAPPVYASRRGTIWPIMLSTWPNGPQPRARYN